MVLGNRATATHSYTGTWRCRRMLPKIPLKVSVPVSECFTFVDLVLDLWLLPELFQSLKSVFSVLSLNSDLFLLQNYSGWAIMGYLSLWNPKRLTGFFFGRCVQLLVPFAYYGVKRLLIQVNSWWHQFLIWNLKSCESFYMLSNCVHFTPLFFLPHARMLAAIPSEPVRYRTTVVPL